MRTQQRRAEIRRPPRPPFDGPAGLIVEDGQVLGRRCALCGTPVQAPRRTWCSQECVDTWNLATLPAAQRRHLEEFHGLSCEGCGGENEPVGYEVEVDHRRPLWALSDTERLQLRWWLPYNLQFLGPRCHAAKTRREAAARANVRRLQAAGREARYAG